MLNFPEDLLYTAGHGWLRRSGKEVVIGITAFAARELGTIVCLDVPLIGNAQAAGDVVGSIAAVKAVADLFLPVAGTILEVNPEALAYPELINADPYGLGWLARLEMRGVGAQLLSAEEYRRLIHE